MNNKLWYISISAPGAFKCATIIEAFSVEAARQQARARGLIKPDDGIGICEITPDCEMFDRFHSHKDGVFKSSQEIQAVFGPVELVHYDRATGETETHSVH